MAIEDQVRINLNQNLWAVVLSLVALGAAEHFGLRTLFWFSVVLAGASTLSVLVTLTVYTVAYCRKKSSS